MFCRYVWPLGSCGCDNLGRGAEKAHFKGGKIIAIRRVFMGIYLKYLGESIWKWYISVDMLQGVVVVEMLYFSHPGKTCRSSFHGNKPLPKWDFNLTNSQMIIKRAFGSICEARNGVVCINSSKALRGSFESTSPITITIVSLPNTIYRRYIFNQRLQAL